MTLAAAELLGRECRYAIRQRHRLLATFKDETAGTMLDVEIVDISVGGVNLRFASTANPPQSGLVRIQIPELSVDAACKGLQRWSHAVSESVSLAGFQLSPRLAADVLEAMRVMGITDRNHLRQQTHLAATVRWELSPLPIPVVILDYSVDGFRLEADQAGEVGKRVLLSVVGRSGKPVGIPAIARWKTERKARTIVGCTFMNHVGYCQLVEGLPSTAG